MTVVECPDEYITTLDGKYIVVSLPPASYCTMSISNAYTNSATAESPAKINSANYTYEEEYDFLS